MKVLSGAGYVCKCASNGQEALEMLSIVPQIFDLVFMDLRMPIMDGLTATAAIRNSLKLSVPVIVLSAEIGAEVQASALVAGCNTFLQKPAKPTEMIGEAARQLARKLDGTQEPKSPGLCCAAPAV